MTARDALDGMKARLAGATPGPWEVFASDYDYPPVDYSIITSKYGDEVACFDNHERKAGEKLNDVTADAAFIAAAPTDVARLIGAVEAVLARMDEWDSYKAWPDAEETQVWYSAGKRHASEAIRALITEALEESQ